MNQIFTLGASTVYGVGGRHGGWADMLKQSIHEKLYGDKNLGETFEVFNFGKAAATINFVQTTFPQQFSDYGRGGITVALVSVGGNNAKAEDNPVNYVSTLEEYSQEMSDLLDMLKEKVTYVIAVGSGYYREEKLNPKKDPFTGRDSYFSNKRKKEFEAECKRLCVEKKLEYIGVENINQEKWLQKYTFVDGLHPNHYGHEEIKNKIWVSLERIFEELR